MGRPWDTIWHHGGSTWLHFGRHCAPKALHWEVFANVVFCHFGDEVPKWSILDVPPKLGEAHQLDQMASHAKADYLI